MELIKNIIKMVAGLAAGVALGLLIAAVGLMCFTDATFAEFLGKLQSVEFVESMLAAAVAVGVFALSAVVLVIGHEAGHLVCGLLSGYKFVSFRIFNFTIIRLGGKLRVKKYAVAGTGGQCLLTPPELPLEKIPTGWYNFGGVLANLLMVAAVLPLLMVKGQPFLAEGVVVFALTGAFLILVNGIPMKVSGAGNDGYNMLALRKDLTSKRALVEALRANALIQNGVRPKDMPDAWFEVPADIDYSNQLQVSIPLMAASRLIDRLKFAEARRAFEALYARRKEIIGLYVKEIACELVFLRLVDGDEAGARQLLDPQLEKYIDAYRRVMSSKVRIQCAMSLLLDHDRGKAEEIYGALLSRQCDYLLQGEVKSDLAVMAALLER